MTDANANRSAYVYDGFDRLSELHFPSPTLGAGVASATDYEAYGYDANSNRTSVRLRSGETIAFGYDALNRETLRDLPDGAANDVYSAYDLAGRRQSARFASAGGQGVIYAYDSAGRLASETSTLGTSRALGFQYDAASNRTRITWPDGVFAQYTYDALNRVDLVQENGANLLADYAYDPLSRRVSITRGNGTTTTAAYDSASRLTNLTQDLSGTINDQTLGFSYTAASQISQRTASNDNYNWTGPNVTRTYNRNGLNQYTSVAGTSFTYDTRGNLTSDGSRTFAYDLENRLLSVSGSASLSLTYDPLGRLRSTTANSVSTEFLYDGDRLVAEYNSAGTLLRRFVHGTLLRSDETDAFRDEPIVWYEGAGTSDRRWLIPDQQNSISATNDGAGTTTIQSYGPYGEPGSWAGSRFRYTGQMALPEVQLYHYRARVFDPILGRFLQTDPVRYEESYNLYQYAANDPLNNTDPMGQITLNLGFEFEIVTPDHRGGERNQGGAGVFINLHEGQLTVGTYSSEGNRGGSDIGVAGTIGLTGGNVRDDFAGRATTVEIDRAAFSGEGGLTESGQLTGSAEFGTPLPGSSAGESNVVVTNEVNVNQAVGNFLGEVANIGDRIRDAAGLPDFPERDER